LDKKDNEMENKIISYPKIYNVGTRDTENLFDGYLIVEEKIDGSQFSFGVTNGNVCVRSKGQQINITNPPKMFLVAIKTVMELVPYLKNGWTYRAEYLSKRKHNVLYYDRVPEKHLMVFDITTDEHNFLSHRDKEAHAKELGLETVPLLYHGTLTDVEQVKFLLDRDSILGGVKIEGIVIKNYDKKNRHGDVLLGKYVSPTFREVHSSIHKSKGPYNKDNGFIGELIKKYKTEARYEKAVQHLKEKDMLNFSTEDIGSLLKEINKDLLEEEGENIKEELFKWAWKQVTKGITNGFPIWYKEKLIKDSLKE